MHYEWVKYEMGAFANISMQIHVYSEGQRRGPFTLDEVNEQLRQGVLSPKSSLAWYAGCVDWMPLGNVPSVIEAAKSFQLPLPPPLPVEQGDATGGVIPYKNPHALTAYYLSIFGLFPLIGILLAIPAVILGISGLKKRKRNPVIKGSVHAWIGIVLGSLSILYNGLIIVAMIVAMLH